MDWKGKLLFVWNLLMPPNTVLPYQLSLMWGPFSSTENKGQEFVVLSFYEPTNNGCCVDSSTWVTFNLSFGLNNEPVNRYL